MKQGSRLPAAPEEETDEECTHTVVTEEESWQTGGVTVTCERCRKLIPFDEWKNSLDGITEDRDF